MTGFDGGVLAGLVSGIVAAIIFGSMKAFVPTIGAADSLLLMIPSAARLALFPTTLLALFPISPRNMGKELSNDDHG